MKKRKLVKRENKNFFAKHYSLSWDYIKECKNYLLLIVLIFVFGAVISFFVAVTGKPEILVEKIIETLTDLMDKSKGLNLWEMVIYILNNNLETSFLALIFGILLGIFPIFITLFNGFILGFVSFFAVYAEGAGVLWKLAPHGIFELPAVFLSLALGVKFGMFWFAKGKRKEFLRRFENSLRVFLFVILPLLIIAAIIEGVLINVSDPCNAVDDLNDRNQCYYGRALEKQNVDICESIEDNLILKQGCYEQLGKVMPED